MPDKTSRDLFQMLAPMFGLERTGVIDFVLHIPLDKPPTMTVTHQVIDFQQRLEVTRKYDLIEKGD